MTESKSEWLFLIKEDYKSAKILLKEKRYITSIYHSHQFTEKIFKYLCLLIKTKIVKTHNLIQLFEILKDDYQNLFPFYDNIILLNDYLPKLRYPFGDKINKSDAVFAFSIADSLLKTFKEQLK